MARVLVVGCGCRGQGLCRALVAHGHSVRATTRTPARVPEIEASGADGVCADPDRLATVVSQLAGVSVVCLLLASATGTDRSLHALHLERVPALARYCIDTPVRGLVYEGAGSVDSRLLAAAAQALEEIATANHMPLVTVRADPIDRSQWLAEMESSVAAVLSA